MISKSGIVNKPAIIEWAPGVSTTGDLEPATTNITDTAKPALPQYTGSITVAALPDARLYIDQYLTRLLTTVDSYNAPATTLNWDIEIQNAAGAYTSRITGSVASPTTGIVFDGVILNDTDVYAPGTAIGVKFFYWADNAAGVVISRVEQWLAAGHNPSIDAGVKRVAYIAYGGIIGLAMHCGVDGAGSVVVYVFPYGKTSATGTDIPRWDVQTGTTAYVSQPCIVSGNGIDIAMTHSGGDANGMYYITYLYAYLI